MFIVRFQVFAHTEKKKEREREDDAGKAEDRSAEAKRREESEGKGLSARGQSRWSQSHLPHLQGFPFFLSFFLLFSLCHEKKIEFLLLGTFEFDYPFVVIDSRVMASNQPIWAFVVITFFFLFALRNFFFVFF